MTRTGARSCRGRPWWRRRYRGYRGHCHRVWLIIKKRLNVLLVPYRPTYSFTTKKSDVTILVCSISTHLFFHHKKIRRHNSCLFHIKPPIFSPQKNQTSQFLFVQYRPTYVFTTRKLHYSDIPGAPMRDYRVVSFLWDFPETLPNNRNSQFTTAVLNLNHMSDMTYSQTSL